MSKAISMYVQALFIGFLAELTSNLIINFVRGLILQLHVHLATFTSCHCNARMLYILASLACKYNWDLYHSLYKRIVQSPVSLVLPISASGGSIWEGGGC